jgi:predicted Abi (CAAX) family protease
MALSVGLFVLWHGLRHRLTAGRWWLARQDPRCRPKPAQRSQPPLQLTLLGTACSLVYVVSGSLWSAVLLHGLAVIAWREGLGGGRQWQATGAQSGG